MTDTRSLNTFTANDERKDMIVLINILQLSLFSLDRDF